MITAQAIHLGPIMLAWPMLIVLTSLLLSIWVAGHFRRLFDLQLVTWQQFKDSIWSAILLGLVIGRVVFVAMDLDYYRLHPLDIFKIQDKGFHFGASVASAALWLLWKNKQQARYIALIFILTCFSLNGLGLWSYKKYQQQYLQFPQVELSDLQQRPQALKQFLGKPTVINLWASWCPPCRREMPVLEAAQQRHPDVNFVFINQGEDAATITQYLQKNHFQLKHVLLDPEGLTAQKTRMYGLPSSLFFDANGQLIESHMGELSQSVLDQKLKNAQGEH